MNSVTFSDIVDALQGDKAKGKKMILDFVDEITHFDAELKKAEENVRICKSNLAGCEAGVKNVLKHLELDLPIAIQNGDELIEIDKKFTIFKIKIML